MMLGTDVSALSTTAATAAAQGLSIVVPVYNEAAGLAFLHQRLGGLAKTLRQRYGLACEVVYVDDGSADATLSIARGLAADALDVQVVSLSRNFGKEAALMAGLDHARRGAVLFMDGDGQHPPDLVEQLVGHWIDGGYRRGLYRQGPSRQRTLSAPACRARLLRADQLGRAAENPGRCRRLPSAVAARGRGAAPASRAQPLLQGAGELDRIPPDPRRLRARRPCAWRHHLQPRPAGRTFDRRPDVVLGRAVAFCQPARRPARFRRLPVRPFDPVGNLGRAENRFPAIPRWWSA